MDCPICKNKRHIFVEGKGWQRCKCVAEMRVERIMKASHFPIPLQKVDSKEFKTNTAAKQNLGKAISIQVNEFNKKPFFIFSTSVEKEKVAAIITRYLVLNHPSIESVRYIDLTNLTENFFSKEPSGEEIDYKDVDVLTLSIGKEITNSAHRSILYNILYDRCVNEKFTIVISSIPRGRILQTYQESVNDLLLQNFEFYEC